MTLDRDPIQNYKIRVRSGPTLIRWHLCSKALHNYFVKSRGMERPRNRQAKNPNLNNYLLPCFDDDTIVKSSQTENVCLKR